MSTTDTLHGHQIFPTLDGMRFVAALLIVARHVPLFGDLSFPESYLAVDLFFVLSGFVIANAYERKLSDGMGWRVFLRIRVIRLYPLYFLGIAIGICAVVAAADHRDMVSLVAEALMSFALIPHGAEGLRGLLFPLDPPVWSLVLEMAVNVVYVASLRQMVGRRLIGLIAVAGTLLVIFVILVAFRHGVDPSRRGLDYGWTLGTLPVGLVRVTFSFYVGVFLFRLHGRSCGRARHIQLGNTVAWLLLGCVAAVLASRLPTSVAPAIELAFVTILFPCLVFVGIRFQPTGWSARVFRLGGLSSYAIYVLHAPLGSLVVSGCHAVLGIDPQSYGPWAGCVFIVALVLVCLAVDAFYDAPIRRALVRVGRPLIAAR